MRVALRMWQERTESTQRIRLNEKHNRASTQSGVVEVQEQIVDQSGTDKSFIAEQFGTDSLIHRYCCPVSNRYNALDDPLNETNAASYCQIYPSGYIKHSCRLWSSKE